VCGLSAARANCFLSLLLHSSLRLPDRLRSDTASAGYPQCASAVTLDTMGSLNQVIPHTEKGIAENSRLEGSEIMLPRKLTLLSVLLFCATWVVAQHAPAGGTPPAGSGTPGQTSPSAPPTGNTGTPPTAGTAQSPTGNTAQPPTGNTGAPPTGSATPGSNPTNPNSPGTTNPNNPDNPNNPNTPNNANPGTNPNTPGATTPGATTPGATTPGSTNPATPNPGSNPNTSNPGANPGTSNPGASNPPPPPPTGPSR
jgi:hypothetical protein